MKNIFVVGINGKMGKALCETATALGYTVCGGLDTVASPAFPPVFTKAQDVDIDFDAVIDFSRPASLDAVIELAMSRKVPAVIATTGYDEAQLNRIKELAKKVPVFRSANMSIGIAALKAAALAARKVLGDGFDIEIVEKHHNRKVDSPSGTALLLADALAQKSEQVFARNGKRNKGEVGITSVRGGGVVGEHEIGFYGEDEIVTLAHSARSRSLFAAGALKAASFLDGRSPAQYDMDDLVAELLK